MSKSKVAREAAAALAAEQAVINAPTPATPATPTGDYTPEQLAAFTDEMTAKVAADKAAREQAEADKAAKDERFETIKTSKGLDVRFSVNYLAPTPSLETLKCPTAAEIMSGFGRAIAAERPIRVYWDARGTGNFKGTVLRKSGLLRTSKRYEVEGCPTILEDGQTNAFTVDPDAVDGYLQDTVKVEQATFKATLADKLAAEQRVHANKMKMRAYAERIITV